MSCDWNMTKHAPSTNSLLPPLVLLTLSEHRKHPGYSDRIGQLNPCNEENYVIEERLAHEAPFLPDATSTHSLWGLHSMVTPIDSICPRKTLTNVWLRSIGVATSSSDLQTARAHPPRTKSKPARAHATPSVLAAIQSGPQRRC